MVMYFIDGKMLVSICFRENSYDFLLLIDHETRERFDAKRNNFPPNILAIYDNMVERDESWMWIPVTDVKTFEAVKQLILIKQQPNRKPFPTEAIYSKCGMRCDLCVYYINHIHGSDSPFAQKVQKILTTFWGDDFTGSCPGCFAKNVTPDTCGMGKLECPKSKGLDNCLECSSYPCNNCGTFAPGLQADGSRTAEIITWAILPYMSGLFQPSTSIDPLIISHTSQSVSSSMISTIL